MRELIKKTRLSIGLYDIRTLASKFVELFFVNRRRYFHPVLQDQPEEIISAAEPESVVVQPDTVPKGGKTIYYLLHCFYPFSQGGTERFVYNMATQARLNGDQVKVITYNATELLGYFKKQVSGIVYNEYKVDGIDVIEYRNKKAPRGILKDIVMEDQAVLDFAEFLFKKDRPDILHVGYFQKTSAFFDACRRFNVPYGITLTSYYCLCHYDVMIDRRGILCGGCEKGEKCRRNCGTLDVADPLQRYRNMHQIFKEAAFLTAPSLFVRKMVEKEFPGIHVKVINHGVSRDLLHANGADVRRQDMHDFAYIGTLSPVKGVHGLIEAFKNLPPYCNLNIYGTGPDEYLRRLKAQARGYDNIVFHGSFKYNDIGQAYLANDIIVVPSIWYETYNFVVHEALLMNRIVVASRIGAMPERIREGINGYTFCPGDWSDLSAVLNRALQTVFEPDSGKKMPISTINTEFRQYDRLYEQACSGG